MKREKTIAFGFLVITAVLAFLAGYGFQKFVKARTKHTMTINLSRRDVSKVDVKRNFESSDRTPADVQHENEEYHKDGIKRINATYIENVLK